MSLLDSKRFVNGQRQGASGRQLSFGIFYNTVLILSLLLSAALVGCGGPSPEELEAIDYSPLVASDWQVSTPAEQGLDPTLVAELYYNAEQLETLYGLLVVKNGHVVAEKYFHTWAVDRKVNVQSVTKSYISVLVGIALDQGCLSSVDQKMMEFFPELASQIKDPRKYDVTIGHLLQMRSGYPWEEGDPALWDALWAGDYVPMVVHFPLVSDPGAEFHYSNLTSDWLGMIVARACDTDLESFAQQHLLSPIGAEVGTWTKYADGYYIGHGEMRLTARDMAKFGWLVLNEGKHQGDQVVSADWLRDSLRTYSEDVWDYRVGPNFQDIGYGYHWWSARAGDHHLNLAWGHGGQLIVLVDALDMVVVITADPLYGQAGDEPWRHEKANINLVADFVSSLPNE